MHYNYKCLRVGGFVVLAVFVGCGATGAYICTGGVLVSQAMRPQYGWVIEFNMVAFNQLDSMWLQRFQ